MKLLNLDELTGVDRPVLLGGKTYHIKEQNIQQLIDSVKTQRTLKSSDTEAVFEALVTSAQSALPEAPEHEIRKLNVTQLQALIKYASASDEELLEATKDDEEGK